MNRLTMMLVCQVAGVAAVIGCTMDGPRSARLALDSLLAQDRRAHLEADVDLLADHLADTLVSLDGGRTTMQSRDSVLAQFERYLAGARYHAWTDLETPLVQLAADGSLATVARTVCVDREEPDGARRVFVTTYLATYVRRVGHWYMTGVSSTFRDPPPAACPA